MVVAGGVVTPVVKVVVADRVVATVLPALAGVVVVGGTAVVVGVVRAVTAVVDTPVVTVVATVVTVPAVGAVADPGAVEELAFSPVPAVQDAAISSNTPHQTPACL